jgi:hypothetical protein
MDRFTDPFESLYEDSSSEPSSPEEPFETPVEDSFESPFEDVLTFSYLMQQENTTYNMLSIGGGGFHAISTLIHEVISNHPIILTSSRSTFFTTGYSTFQNMRRRNGNSFASTN